MNKSKNKRENKELTQKLAKELRNEIGIIIEKWITEKHNELKKEEANNENYNRVLEEVRECAYNNLIWKTLKKEERYNNIFYNELFKKLKKEHPDLELVNGLKTFVRWPIFDKELIEAAYSENINDFKLD